VHHHVNQLPSPLHSSYPKSKLYLASSTTDTVVAGATLILSSTTGILFEKYISNGGGHVITLLTSALLSNLSQVLPIRSIPTNHYLYDWCWSVFLPASLVFALLSSSPSSGGDAATTSTVSTEQKSNKSKAILKSTIQGMTIPFILGSIGSIIGCISSYHFVSMPYNTRDISALLAGCLCASYIGGTVNFFATANVLKKNSVISNDVGSAFGSMAAADLVVMAIYFCMLQTVSRSNWLHKLFPSKVSRGDDSISKEGEEQDDDTALTTQSNHKHSITSSIVASFIALSSVLLATTLEQKVTSTFGIPGTMCAFLAILGLIYQRLIHYVISSHQEWKPGAKPLSSFTHIISSLQGISKVAPTLSNICFYLLFAAVGTAADLSSAIVGGPSALVFASLALFVHSITVVGGSWIGMRLLNSKSKLLNKFGWQSSSWEEVLTATNAAIGGPSTASAFAVGLIPSENKNDVTNDKRSQYRSALVIGATFWGVFGYAIATSEF